MARSERWFSYGGRSSEDMGLRVTRLPDVQIAEARGEEVTIPGRDGALWLSDSAYRPVTHRIEFEIGGDADVDAVAAWLSGAGALILSTFPEYYWKARIVRGFELCAGIYVGGRWRATVEFSCDPFRYEVGDPVMAPITQATVFDGDGTARARPVITVTGQGDIDLMVNDSTVLISGLDGSVIIDCDAMMAFIDGENASPMITILSDDDAWPYLLPGSNAVSWSGSASAVTIQPNWRWR